MTTVPQNIKVGKYFTLAEMCASDTAKKKGINNEPTVEVAVNLCMLCRHILDPLREALKCPITISSGYRSPALNKAVGGVSNSQHMKGQAVDINLKGNIEWGKTVFGWIKKYCEFDQLIWERSGSTYWVHVSFALGHNRKQAFELSTP